MLAIIQLIFISLSIISTILMGGLVIKNINLSKIQWIFVLLPYMMVLITFAYSFDWISNSNNDLSRYIQDIEQMKITGFWYHFNYADNFSVLYRVVAWIFCHTTKYQLLPVISIVVEYSICIYIISSLAGENKISPLDVLVSGALKFAFIPPIMSISASRNTVAYALFALGIYVYSKKGLKNVWAILLIASGLLMHTTVIIGVIVFLLSLIIQKKPKLICVLILWGLAINAILAVLKLFNTSYISYFSFKIDYYIRNPSQFDTAKATIIIGWFILLFVIFMVWAFKHTEIFTFKGSCYFLCQMAVTLGAFGTMNEMFLRMCYPIGMLFPMFLSQINQSRKVQSKIDFMKLIITGIAIFAFVRTGGGWLYQIYWFMQ